MEILLWLAPAGVATLLAMLWAGWRGRAEAAARDPERRTAARAAALRRLGRALERPFHPVYAPRRGPVPRADDASVTYVEDGPELPAATPTRHAS